MKKFILILTFLFSSLHAGGVNSGSIFLINDSPFILTATVLSADGSFLGEFTVQPGQQKNFTQNVKPTDLQYGSFPDVSYTPFTVIWQCPSEGYYSVCSQVPAGSSVRASACPGSYFCNPKDKSKEGKEPASILKKKK